MESDKIKMIEDHATVIDKNCGIFGCKEVVCGVGPSGLVTIGPVVFGGVPYTARGGSHGWSVLPVDVFGNFSDAEEQAMFQVIANARKLAFDRMKMTNAEYLCVCKELWDCYFRGRIPGSSDLRFFGMYVRPVAEGVSLPGGAQFMIVDRPMDKGGH